MNTINILGINISVLNKRLTLGKIELFLKDGKQHYIVTPNPEIILTAQKDEEFFYILNKTDIAIPDGFGLNIAALLTGKSITRITGADLTKDILYLAQKKKLKVAIFNWRKGLSKTEDIKKALKKHCPSLRFIIEEVDREWRMPYYQNTNIFQPDIALVALGAPWQEKFIYHSLPNMPFIKLAIGVGGAFDFLTGKIKRAPKFLRILGLEWIWRLGQQPWRAKRIYNAVIVFPWQFFKWRFVYPFLYRPNVACLLYKKGENNKYFILLVERAEEMRHWQLPQGGIDNLDIRGAGIKELSEEINCNKFKSIAVFSDLWKYKMDKSKPKRHIGYKGQKQGLFIAEFLGKDSDIKVNFWDHSNWKWVNSENLIEEVHPCRKKAATIFLEKFNKIIKSY